MIPVCNEDDQGGRVGESASSFVAEISRADFSLFSTHSLKFI